MPPSGEVTNWVDTKNKDTVYQIGDIYYMICRELKSKAEGQDDSRDAQIT